MTLAELVRAELDAAGWFQADLARVTGYSPKHVSQVLAGKDGLSERLARMWLAALGRALVLSTTPLLDIHEEPEVARPILPGNKPTTLPERQAARQRILDQQLERAHDRARQFSRSHNCYVRQTYNGADHEPCDGGPTNCLCPCHDPKESA